SKIASCMLVCALLGSPVTARLCLLAAGCTLHTATRRAERQPGSCRRRALALPAARPLSVPLMPPSSQPGLLPAVGTRLPDDFTQLSHMIRVVLQAHQETLDGSQTRCPFRLGARVGQVGAIGPHLQAGAPHAAALLKPRSTVCKGRHRLPGDLATR